MEQLRARINCFEKLVVFHVILWLAKLASKLQHHILDSWNDWYALDIEKFEISSLPIPNCTLFTH